MTENLDEYTMEQAEEALTFADNFGGPQRAELKQTVNDLAVGELTVEDVRFSAEVAAKLYGEARLQQRAAAILLSTVGFPHRKIAALIGAPSSTVSNWLQAE